MNDSKYKRRVRYAAFDWRFDHSNWIRIAKVTAGRLKWGGQSGEKWGEVGRGTPNFYLLIQKRYGDESKGWKTRLVRGFHLRSKSFKSDHNCKSYIRKTKWGAQKWGEVGRVRRTLITFDPAEIIEWFQSTKDAPTKELSNDGLIVQFGSVLQKLHPINKVGRQSGEKWGGWNGISRSRRDTKMPLKQEWRALLRASFIFLRRVNRIKIAKVTSKIRTRFGLRVLPTRPTSVRRGDAWHLRIRCANWVLTTKLKGFINTLMSSALPFAIRSEFQLLHLIECGVD